MYDELSDNMRWSHTHGGIKLVHSNTTVIECTAKARPRACYWRFR